MPELSKSTSEYGYSFGSATYPKGGVYGPMARPYAMLLVIEQGAAELEIDNNNYRVEQGQSACIVNRQPLTIHYPRDTSTRSSWCETQPEALPETSHKWITDTPAVLKSSRRFETLFGFGLDLGEKPDPNVGDFRNSIGNACFRAFLYEAHVAVTEEPIPRSFVNARQYLEAHYLDDCSVNELAQRVGVSPQHLIYGFRRHFGTTPVRYLWRLRLAKGVNLLLRSGLSISEIAYQAGYKNPYHFSRQVKEQYGVAPKIFRQRKGFQDSSLDIENIEDIVF